MSARLTACLLATVALCGCGGHFPLIGDVQSTQAVDLMKYFGRTSLLDVQGQKQELARARQECTRPARSLACLRLGGLYAQPSSGLRNDALALALLGRQTGASGQAGEGPRPLADLAALLLVQVEERQRLARSEEKKQEALHSTNETLRARVRAINAVERETIEREDRARSERVGRQ